VIVDSSAITAVLLRQPEYQWVVDQLSRSPAVGVGTPTLAETGIVLTAKLGVRGRTLLVRLVEEAGLIVIPFTEQHARLAIDAYRRFGKGKHPARLNFGDCLAYATAKLAEEPLLCLGDDFAKTDLQVVRKAVGKR
jgi:ribonuclease VapC